MLFFGIEKKIPAEQAEIQERRKAEALDAGVPYISPEEQEKQDEEEFRKATLETDLEQLRKKCDKKHLDYEAEKAKYLDKQAKKEAKQHD